MSAGGGVAGAGCRAVGSSRGRLAMAPPGQLWPLRPQLLLQRNDAGDGPQMLFHTFNILFILLSLVRIISRWDGQ